MLASKRNGTLYVGSTSDLIRRIWEHKKKNVIPSGFTAQYNVHMLVYYEIHSTYLEAARRARFKYWCRKWKLNLIEEFNPTWRDLYEEIGTDMSIFWIPRINRGMSVTGRSNVNRP
jgi:putative endonuclease